MTKRRIIYLIFAAAFILMACSRYVGDNPDKQNNKTPGIVNNNGDVITVPELPKEPDINDNGMEQDHDDNSSGKEQPDDGEKQGDEVFKKIVVIDPGHANRANNEKEPIAPGSSVMKIKDGGGATGIVTKTPEYVIAMEVSMMLKAHLEERGFKVVMTKTEHSVSLGNVERAEIWNNEGADLVIRIHCDSYKDSSVKGASMFVPDIVNENTLSIYDESKRCAQIVLNKLTEQVGMKNRGLIFSREMTGFNWSKVPVILVEMGFLSNPEEDRLLSSPDYQSRLAKALAEGIEEAFK